MVRLAFVNNDDTTDGAHDTVVSDLAGGGGLQYFYSIDAALFYRKCI